MRNPALQLGCCSVVVRTANNCSIFPRLLEVGQSAKELVDFSSIIWEHWEQVTGAQAAVLRAAVFLAAGRCLTTTATTAPPRS